MNRLGNLAPFFCESTPLSECAQFGMAPGEPARDEHGGKDKLTEALAAPCSLEERRGLLEVIDGPTIVTLGLVGEAEGAVRLRVQEGIPAGRGEREGTLGCSNGLIIRSPADEIP